MALSTGSLCLGVPGLLSPSSLRTVFRCPHLALCTVGNPSPSSMGWSQSRVIGEVVAPVALFSGIALSPKSQFRYGRHRRKAVISFRSPSLVLLGFGSTTPPPSPTVSSGGHVTAYRQFVAVLRHTLLRAAVASLSAGLFCHGCVRGRWAGCRVFMLPHLTLRGYASFRVCPFRWAYGFLSRLPHTC